MNCRMSFISFLLVPLLLVFHKALGCLPQGPGNCYSGSYSGGAPTFYNQKCAQDGLSDWCAVTYHPTSNLANFGCASSFSQQIGMPTCGDSALSINQQGCNMVNTPSGPCYFCCCKGGNCNHPRVFAEQAQSAFGDVSPYQTTYAFRTSSSSNQHVTRVVVISMLIAILSWNV